MGSDRLDKGTEANVRQRYRDCTVRIEPSKCPRREPNGRDEPLHSRYASLIGSIDFLSSGKRRDVTCASLGNKRSCGSTRGEGPLNQIRILRVRYGRRLADLSAWRLAPVELIRQFIMLTLTPNLSTAPLTGIRENATHTAALHGNATLTFRALLGALARKWARL